VSNKPLGRYKGIKEKQKKEKDSLSNRIWSFDDVLSEITHNFVFIFKSLENKKKYLNCI